MYYRNVVLHKNMLVFFMLLIFSCNSLANVDERIHQCTIIKSNAKRLQCFDSVFGTPISAQKLDEKELDSEIPKIVSNIFTLAQNTNNTEMMAELSDLHFAFQSEENGQAAIYIACKDNITRFQIVLSNPITINPLSVEIKDATDKVISQINWQSAERGYMLDAGRGLYAIQQLKSMLYTDTFYITLPQEKRNYTFKNNGLASHIASIRKECGW